MISRPGAALLDPGCFNAHSPSVHTVNDLHHLCYPQWMRPSDQTHWRPPCKACFKIHIEMYFQVSKGLSWHPVLSWRLGIWRAELKLKGFLDIVESQHREFVGQEAFPLGSSSF